MYALYVGTSSVSAVTSVFCSMIVACYCLLVFSNQLCPIFCLFSQSSCLPSSFCSVIVVFQTPLSIFCRLLFSSCCSHFLMPHVSPLGLLGLCDRVESCCCSTSAIRSSYPLFFSCTVHYVHRTFALTRGTSLSRLSSSYLTVPPPGVKGRIQCVKSLSLPPFSECVCFHY